MKDKKVIILLLAKSAKNCNPTKMIPTSDKKKKK